MNQKRSNQLIEARPSIRAAGLVIIKELVATRSYLLLLQCQESFECQEFAAGSMTPPTPQRFINPGSWFHSGQKISSNAATGLSGVGFGRYGYVNVAETDVLTRGVKSTARGVKSVTVFSTDFLGYYVNSGC